MLSRMIGAALLRTATYEDVEHDPAATLQAFLVVIIASVAAGIGLFLFEGGNLVSGIGGGVARALIGWGFWALVTFLVGTTILKTPATQASWSQLARGTGFAQTPSILQIFVFIPVMGPVIGFAAFAWWLIAMVIAVRQALDYTSTLRAVGVVLIGLIIMVIALSIVFAIAVALGFNIIPQTASVGT